MLHVNEKINALSEEEREALNNEAIEKLNDLDFYKENNIEYHNKPTMNNFFQIKKALYYEKYEKSKTN